MGQPIESCTYRYAVRRDRGGETARCQFLERVLGAGPALPRVCRGACESCCRWSAPSAARLNPAVASLVFHAASRILAAPQLERRDADKAGAVRDWAARHLAVVASREPGREVPGIRTVPGIHKRISRKVTVACFTAHLFRDEPFVHLRYGDGEWYSMLGWRGKNGDGHGYFPQTLGRELRESLDYAAGLPARSRCYVGLADWPCKPVHHYLAAHPRLDRIAWVGANLFSEGLRDFSTLRFLEAVRDYPGRKYLVANEALGLVARALGCEHVVIPRIDCYLEIQRARRACKFRGPGIVVCCAGMASEGLLVSLHRNNASGTYIDFGHSFDAMVGLRTRGYTRANSKGIVDFLQKHYTRMLLESAEERKPSR